jgi:translation initiation factor 3 subunit M
VAEDAGESDEAYHYLLQTLRTFSADEASNNDARDLSVKALKSALSNPSHFDFQDLIDLDSIQALKKSDPNYTDLLDIFHSEQLDDYNDFRDQHDGWVEEQGLDTSNLYRKMRLLTLTSLAASTQSRSLPYQHIAKALQIPAEDVEMWVIDVIRAGLVEGKLSQLNQTFLIHRATYRVFAERQWTEVLGRLDTWKTSLERVLSVVRQEREKVIQEKERELREIEGRANGQASSGAGMSGGRGPQRYVEARAE